MMDHYATAGRSQKRESCGKSCSEGVEGFRKGVFVSAMGGNVETSCTTSESKFEITCDDHSLIITFPRGRRYVAGLVSVLVEYVDVAHVHSLLQ